jgi:hypothetical protein
VETDLKAEGPRIGFSEDLRMLLVSVTPETVPELDTDRLQESITSILERLFGLGGVVRALRRKGRSWRTKPRFRDLLHWARIFAAVEDK